VAIKTAWTGSRLLPSSQHSAPKPLPSSAGRPGDADMWTLRCSGQCSAAPSPQCLSCVHPNFPNQGVHKRRRAVLSGASQRCRGARRGASSASSGAWTASRRRLQKKKRRKRRKRRNRVFHRVARLQLRPRWAKHPLSK